MPRKKVATTKRQVARKTSRATAKALFAEVERLRSVKASEAEMESFLVQQISNEISLNIPQIPIVRDVARLIIRK